MNLFSLTSKRDEPYLTQVFAYLLANYPRYREYLFEQCFGLAGLGSFEWLEPEHSETNGRPDIFVKFKDARVAIENKIDANFTPEQIQRYKKEYGKVILIYRYLADVEQGQFADIRTTWNQVHDFTCKHLQIEKGLDEVQKKLLVEFVKYLEEEGMAADRVTWEIVQGTKALKNLYSQILEAFERLKSNGSIKKYTHWSRTDEYNYWRLTNSKDKEMDVSVNFDPLTMTCSFNTPSNQPNFRKMAPIYKSADKNDWLIDELSIENGHYLCEVAEKQVSSLQEFMATSLKKLETV